LGTGLIDYIGLTGYARSGKDTVANYLNMRYGHKKVSFADPIKEALYVLTPIIFVRNAPEEDEQTNEIIRSLGVPSNFLTRDGVGGSYVRLSVAVDHLGWEHLKELSPETRNLMQRMGSEVGRMQWGENFWVEKALQKLIGERRFVVSDVRYKNEAMNVLNYGAEIWLIEREDVGPANGHPSESGITKFPYTRLIKNNGTPDELYDQIDAIMKEKEKKTGEEK
jgi:hypothetical protein